MENIRRAAAMNDNKTFIKVSSPNCMSRTVFVNPAVKYFHSSQSTVGLA